MRGRKKSDSTRQAILQCACEIFSERDFHEVLTDDIAERLGMGKGTIYRYFASKEDLYLAAITDGLQGLHDAVTVGLEQDASLEISIETLVQTLVGYFWRKRDLFILLHRLEAKLPASKLADWQSQRDGVVRMVQRVLNRAVARGVIPRLHTRLAVEALFGMIRGVCLYRADSDRSEEVVRLVTGMFLAGIGVSPPSKGRALRRGLRIVEGGHSH